MSTGMRALVEQSSVLLCHQATEVWSSNPHPTGSSVHARLLGAYSTPPAGSSVHARLLGAYSENNITEGSTVSSLQ